ncbi:hypothetical protein MTO96_049572 [Rhipicephalus appendiculatus]
MKKDLQISSALTYPGNVCKPDGWNLEGLDPRLPARSVQGQVDLAIIDTAATLKQKMLSSGANQGFAVFDVEFDMNCRQNQWELLRIIKTE